MHSGGRTKTTTSWLTMKSIDRFDDAVYGVFQGLISQTNKVSGMEAIKRYIMPKDLGEIIYNMQTNTCLVCDVDEERELFRIEGNL